MAQKLDIKTLKTIHTLCACGSVVQTAKILGVSPSAISYTLNKARKITGTALFFRSKTGMVPGSQAKELSQAYQQIMTSIDPQGILSVTDKRIFTVSSYSLLELLLSTALLSATDTFPRIKFCPSPDNESTRLGLLRNKEIDIDIGTRLPVDQSVIQLKFFSSDISAVVRKNHPTLHDELTLSDWSLQEHAVWFRGMHLISDDVEQTSRSTALFEQRNVAFVASSTLNLVMLCANSDLLILLPTTIAKNLTSIMSLNVLTVPSELNMNYECYLHYHRSLSADVNLIKLIHCFQNAVSQG